MKMEQTESSETSAYKIQTPGNYPEENIQHTEHGESLKSRTNLLHFKYQYVSTVLGERRYVIMGIIYRNVLCEWKTDIINVKLRILILSSTYAYVTELLSYLKVYQMKCCEHFKVYELFKDLGI